MYIIIDTQSDDPYETFFNSLNEEYGLDLGYVKVDPSKVTIEEYKKITREIAAQQRDLLNYIELRKTGKIMLSQKTENSLYASAASVVKTRTKPTMNLPDFFTITATYTDYGSTVSKCSNASIGQPWSSVLAGHRFAPSTTSYSVIDAARTATVSIKGTLVMGGIITNNYTMYAEFYASEA